jgi:hypothetical protein
VFTPAHDAYWEEARRQLGDSKGTKAMVEVLLLHRTVKTESVLAGMVSAFNLCTVSPEVVMVEARRHAGEHLAPVVPIGDFAKYARPAPDLSRYDHLLAAAEVTL